MKGSIKLIPSDEVVGEGQALRLMCQIESEPPANFTWTLNNKPLPHHKRYFLFIYYFQLINQLYFYF